jgi:hypothetical protein
MAPAPRAARPGWPRCAPARVRAPVEANLTRGAEGLSGTVVVALPGRRDRAARTSSTTPCRRAVAARLAWVPAGARGGRHAGAGGLRAGRPGWPAGWRRTTNQRLLLADARGTVWTGSAVPVLTGGSDSRDARALPGRLHWSLGLAPGWLAPRLELRCATPAASNDELRLRMEPGLGRLRLSLPPGRQAVGHWPAGWLAAWARPGTRCSLGGSVQPGRAWSVETVQGRWKLAAAPGSNCVGVSRCRRSTRWAATAWCSAATPRQGRRLADAEHAAGPAAPERAAASGPDRSCASAARRRPTRAARPC